MQDYLKSRTVEGPGGCWLWQGCVNKQGYGKLRLGGKHYLAHRYSFEQAIGSPEGYLVLHKCDVPGCVNPKHLYLGDQKKNMQDCLIRGRMLRASGERNGRAVATVAQISEIRLRLSRGEPGKVIAAALGLSESIISRVRTGQSWRLTK